MASLEDKVVLITGAGADAGIGAATATLLAERGAGLILVDLPGSDVADIAGGLRANGAQAIHIEADISDEAQVVRVFQETRQAYGRLDGLDNNAAATHLVPRDVDITDMDMAVWDGMFAVNIRAPLMMMKHAIPLMIENGGGAIVNVSSTLSMAGEKGLAAYGASKAGLNQLTRSVATQYGRHGIRCNTLAPGLVLSPRARGRTAPMKLEVYERNNLVNRLGRPRDIAGAVAFLLSDESGYMTGTLMVMDGGNGAHHTHWAQMRALEN
jgi:NAD(P)-dependent dehydrogenase (short-subunit alcohol dehydrogenase family)